MTLKWKILRPIIIIILILIGVLSILPQNISADSRTETEITIWSKSTKGQLYSYTGPDAVDTYNCGYADGNGNFFLTGYKVAKNQTLIIKPGVTIKLEGYASGQFSVWGSIRAIGTEAEPIVFTSNKSDPDFEAWQGFHVWGDYTGETTFENCTFEYCDLIEIARNFTFKNCDFHKTEGITTSAPGGGAGQKDQIIVTNCSFTGDNPESFGYLGLTLWGSPYIIFNDNYVDEQFFNINPSSMGYVEFNRNEIIGTGMYGVTVKCGDEGGTFLDNIITGQYVKLFGEMPVKRNEIQAGGLLMSEVLDVTDNEIQGSLGLYFNAPPKSFTNNYIDANFSYYGYTNDSEPLDIRYSYWSRDYYVEELLGFEKWPILDGKVLFEPYYDKNGTLTDNDGTANGWEVLTGFDMYEDDSYLDPDSDGLSNLEEYSLYGGYFSIGLDPHNNDTDGDGLDDKWEVDFGSNPTTNDSDSDGMPDPWEIKYHLDPTNFDDSRWDFEYDIEKNPERYPNLTINVSNKDDVPGDGYLDDFNDYQPLTNWEEYILGLDPNNCDTDGDGMEDGWELKYDFDPLDPNDGEMDFDEDGWSNLKEFQNETSPLNHLDHPDEPENGDDDDITGSFLVIAVIVIIPVIIVLGLVVFIQYKLKKKSKAESEKRPHSETKKDKLKKAQVLAEDDKPKDRKNKKSGKQKKPVAIECPGCSHTFKVKSGQSEIKCPECGLEGEL